MKRYQYVVAATCLLLSAMGFVGIYTTNQAKENEESEKIVLDSDTEYNQSEDNQIAEIEEKPDAENQISKDDKASTDNENLTNSDVSVENESPENLDSRDEASEDDVLEEETPVGTITQEALHFNPENGVVWPIEGSVLLDYSMDSTIFFPTLQQYQYNPAMVLSGAVNDKVYFVAKGKITNIETNEVTGCTVTQDIGDGYTAIYGQLKELNFEVGDMVESGQVVGYVSEPTKYYSVEGSNVYFQLLKNGVPVDPEEILP